MINKIYSSDISFVLQGKNVKGQTFLCCQSIRKHFPNAEIIFSTYINEDVSDLDIDVLVESSDPGATLLSGKMYNNINRILTTTKNGLAKVSRPFCVKCRSDLYFDNDKILALLSSFPKRNPAYSIFKNRVIFYQLWSRKSEIIACEFPILCPWHLSDWLCFGLTEDIKNYFSGASLTNEPQFSNHFSDPTNRLKGFFDSNVKWKFPPEQYFCTSFFKQYFKEANMHNLQDYSEETMQKSREILASNIIIAGYKETGAYIQKKEYSDVSKNFDAVAAVNEGWLGGVYTHLDFLADYKKYCDPAYSLIPYKIRYFLHYPWVRSSMKKTKYQNGNKITRYLGGVVKKVKTPKSKKFYLFGVQVWNRKRH